MLKVEKEKKDTKRTKKVHVVLLLLRFPLRGLGAQYTALCTGVPSRLEIKAIVRQKRGGKEQ